MQNDKGYIIELIRSGDYVKVSAIDPQTGQEACILAPATGVTRKYMTDLAIRKLEYVKNKEKQEG